MFDPTPMAAFATAAVAEVPQVVTTGLVVLGSIVAVTIGLKVLRRFIGR